MKSRSGLAADDRDSRSRLRRLLEDPEPILHGSLIPMARTCGHPTCRCVRKGQKHRSLYVGQTRKGKTRMKHVPHDQEGEVKRWVDRYHQAHDLLESISDAGWRAIHRRSGNRVSPPASPVRREDL